MDIKEDTFNTDNKFAMAAHTNRVSKGNDSLKHEYNKQLLLELIIKKLGKDPKTYHSKNHLHSEIKLLIQDTMSRFKTMRTLYGEANFLNDYDRLYELVTGRKMEANSAIEREIETMKKSSKLDLIRYEALLRSRFIECSDEIVLRKNYINDLQRANTQKEKFIKDKEQAVNQRIEAKRQEEEEIMAGGGKAHRNIRVTNNKAMSLYDHIKIQHLEEKMAELQKTLSNERAQILLEIDGNKSDIQRVEIEISDLKMKRVIYKYRLKECYVLILKKPKVTM